MLPSGTDTSSAAAPLQDLENDPLSINKPATKLTHQLCLASAYGAYGDAADNGPEVARQKGRVDHDFFEPKFSNVGRDFKGTLDYILYTTDTLVRHRNRCHRTGVHWHPRSPCGACVLCSASWSFSLIAACRCAGARGSAGAAR